MKHIKKIVAVIASAVLLGATLTGCVVGQDKYNQQVQQAQELQTQLTEANADNAFLTNELGTAAERLAQQSTALENYQTELDEKDQALLAYEQSVADSADLEENTHTYDELTIGETVKEVASNREIVGLFDGEVEFDDEDYEVEESVTLSDLSITVNGEDFGSTTYLSVPNEGIDYTVQFDSTLDTSLVDEDETLEFSFLGQDVEVTDWDGDQLTFNRGVKHDLTEGQSVVAEGKNITLVTAGEDWAYVDVDGVKKKINEDDTTRVNGVEIKVKEVIPAEPWRGGMATLEVGEEVEETIENGDEYAEDSVWEYSITESSLGLVLTEEFTELDEEFEVLAAGDQICLPNNYVCVQYDGLAEEDYHGYDIELDSVSGVEYVRVDGDFQNGLEDYDRVYLNGTQFLDEDMEFIVDGEIALVDSDVTLTTNGTSLSFGSLSFPVSLDAVWDGMDDVSGRDEDYITSFGTIVRNPEDAVEDLSFTIEIPEEQVEGSVSLIKRG